MKKIQVLGISIVILFALACNPAAKLLKKNTSMLVGTWNYSSISASGVNDPMYKSEIESFLNSIIKNSSMTFHADNTFKFVFNGEEKTGKWKFSSDYKYIHTSEKEKDTRLNVNELTLESLSITGDTDEGPVTIILKKK